MERPDGLLPFDDGRLPEDDEDEVAFEWPTDRAVKPPTQQPPPPRPDEDLTQGVPWDELADERPPQYLTSEQPSAFAPASPADAPTEQATPATAPPPPADPPPEPQPVAPQPHTQPTQPHTQPAGYPASASRMDSLQAALASIRDRVQTLSTTVGSGAQGPPGRVPVDLALYRQASEERTLAEVRRHSRDTEDLLKRMSGNMQDLSNDLRSIVEAARSAIDQTSAQVESSVALGRLLGERMEQLDEQVAARFDQIDEDLAARLEQVEGKVERHVERLRAHVDKRLTKIEQRGGVGILREEVGELRGEVGELRSKLTGDLRGEVGDLRTKLVGEVRGELRNELRLELGELQNELTSLSTGLGGLSSELASLREELADAVAESSNQELQHGLQQVNQQLNQTLASLASLVEGAPEQDEAVVEEVVSAIKLETEAAVEPFRTEVEELGRQLGEALGREDDLGEVLGTLTEEVQRLRRRISARAEPATLDDQQLQSIVDAVVTALPAGPAPRREPVRVARRHRPEERGDPDEGDELDVVDEDELEDHDEAEELEEFDDVDEPDEPDEPEPPPPPRRLGRKRPVKAKKAARPTAAKGDRPVVKARKAGSSGRRSTR